jgi:hypothetical protein
MTLPEALESIFNHSARITRTIWRNRNIYCGLEEGRLCIKGWPDDGKWHPWTITEEDYYAADWEVVE